MRRRRAALTVALVAAAVVVVQGLGGDGWSSMQPALEPSASPTAAEAGQPGGRTLLPLPRAPDRADDTGGAASVADLIAVSLSTTNKIALVDPVAARVTQTVDPGLLPGALTLAPDGRSAWVFSTKPGQNVAAVIDLLSASKKDDRHFHDGDGPSAVAFSSDGSRAYVAMDGDLVSPPGPSTIAFVSMSGGEFGRVALGVQSRGVQIRRQLSSMAVSKGPDGADTLYAAAQASGTVWVLDAGSGAQRNELELGGGPLALVADGARQRMYVALDTLNQVATIDTATQTITSRIALPASPTAAVLGPDGTLYVVGGDPGGELWVIGPGDDQIRARAPIGGRPAGVAIAADGSRLYVADAGSGVLSTVNTSDLKLTATIPLGDKPVGIVAVSRPVQDPRKKPTPTRTPAARPTSTPMPTLTPTIVPAPTAILDGARLPEHVPTGAVTDDFLTGADFPVTLTFAPDGRLFYNELRTGKIRVVQNGVLLPDPFYQFVVAGEPETGLIGMVLDPDFVRNHYVYVFYTSVPEGQGNGGPNGPNQVVRLTDVANKGTQLTPILRDLPSGPIHNSGTLRFGPDGKLYVALGDNDQGTNAEDLSTLAGKILRVNRDGSAPDDNPFVGQPGKQPAIWAYGLRNPYSFAFHPVGHQVLAVENGPGDNDELDVILRGANYGWPPTGYKYRPGVVDPIAVFNPTIGPTGSTFYLSDQIPEWQNDWFYCNYHQGQLRRVRLAPGSFDRIVFEEVVKAGCSFDVATGPDGALYYTDAKGIYRIHADGANVLPAVISAAVPGADAKPTPTALPAGTRAEDRDVDVSLSEWKVQPSRGTVPAGTITLVSENIGATQHALRLVGGGLDVTTDTFGPGQSRTLQAVLGAGTYQLICPIPGHAEQGMRSTLTVVGD